MLKFCKSTVYNLDMLKPLVNTVNQQFLILKFGRLICCCLSFADICSPPTGIQQTHLCFFKLPLNLFILPLNLFKTSSHSHRRQQSLQDTY